MSDTDLFALTCLPCPICKMRYHRGATIRIVAMCCSACKHCEHHCRCVARPSLESLLPFDFADRPIEVIGEKNL
jgi:hypothetical protein